MMYLNGVVWNFTSIANAIVGLRGESRRLHQKFTLENVIGLTARNSLQAFPWFHYSSQNREVEFLLTSPRGLLILPESSPPLLASHVMPSR